ncbi:MAG: T9SS type A sorting domain-containing protein [Bacteroidia bacterium]
MKKSLYTMLVAIFCLFAGHLYAQAKNSTKTAKWQAIPFDHKLFIENKGQFDNDVQTPSKILYMAMLGNVKAYFTATGIIYRYDEYPKREKGDKPDEEIVKPVLHYLNATWEGANANSAIETQGTQTYYYTYPVGAGGTIKANIVKKIIYRNLYPGIDIEYKFPENKSGIEYTITVHPGANLALVKLKYNGANLRKEINGDLVFSSEIGTVTEHAPVSFYKTADGNANAAEPGFETISQLQGDEESFTLKGNVDHSKTLIIDPWVTNPNFTASYNKAYDIDFDNAGNVYAYGSGNPYQLTKFNSAGVQQWTFNASTIDEQYYGDFAVDKVTGTAYIAEGFYGGTGAGAKALKVNTLGTLSGTFPGNAGMLEMWRATYSTISRQIVIAGGGTNTPNTQACMLDTNMANMVPVNPLNTTACCHDAALIAMDPSGSTVYMGLAYPYGSSSSADPDILMSLPIPALNPANYAIDVPYTFEEVGSIPYVENTLGNANGMNGMAASPNFLYLYDGSKLSKLNKITGAVIATTIIAGGTQYASGGLDADACDNVYVGENSSIEIFNSSLTLQSTISLNSTVYDVQIGNGNIYTCGNGFVEAISNPLPTAGASAIATYATCGANNGSVTAGLFLCSGGTPDSLSYLWSPGGQTTQTISNLAAGTYSVTITSSDSVYHLTATVGTTPISVTATTSTPALCSGDSAMLVGGGATSYTWSTGQTNDTITVKPAVTTTYTVTGKDTNGCSANAIVTVNIADLTAYAYPSSVCIGDSTILTASGGVTYMWNTGATTSSIIVKPTITATYTATGGCKDTAKITITVDSVPVTKISGSDSIALGANEKLYATGACSYKWSPATGLNITTGDSVTANPTITTTYTVTGSCGICSSIDSFTVHVAVATGIKNILHSNSITVYPDPVANTLNLSSGIAGTDETATIIIVDAVGREIINTNATIGNGKVFTMDVSSLAQGLYFVKVATSTSTRVVKFIKE